MPRVEDYEHMLLVLFLWRQFPLSFFLSLSNINLTPLQHVFFFPFLFYKFFCSVYSTILYSCNDGVLEFSSCRWKSHFGGLVENLLKIPQLYNIGNGKVIVSLAMRLRPR
jgi:hypothetical protein